MRLLLSALLVTLPGLALATPAEEAAAARIGYYKLVGLEMSGLSAMAKGEAPYDAEKAQAHAADLLALSGYSHDDTFAPGTSNADLPGKTRALPAIWENLAAFQEKGMAYRDAVVALNTVAGTGAEALAPAVGKLGGTCKACHDDYRAKDF